MPAWLERLVKPLPAVGETCGDTRMYCRYAPLLCVSFKILSNNVFGWLMAVKAFVPDSYSLQPFTVLEVRMECHYRFVYYFQKIIKCGCTFSSVNETLKNTPVTIRHLERLCTLALISWAIKAPGLQWRTNKLIKYLLFTLRSEVNVSWLASSTGWVGFDFRRSVVQSSNFVYLWREANVMLNVTLQSEVQKKMNLTFWVYDLLREADVQQYTGEKPT